MKELSQEQIGYPSVSESSVSFISVNNNKLQRLSNNEKAFVSCTGRNNLFSCFQEGDFPKIIRLIALTMAAIIPSFISGPVFEILCYIILMMYCFIIPRLWNPNWLLSYHPPDILTASVPCLNHSSLVEKS